MMKSNQSFCLATRLSCLLGLRAVCCCILLAASDANADLTNDVSRILDILENDMVNVYPYGANEFYNLSTYLGRLLSSSGRVSQLPNVDDAYLYQIKQILLGFGNSSNDLSRVVSLLSGLSGLGEITNGWGYATADTLHQQMDLIEYYLQGVWVSASQMEFRFDTHGNELLVAAPDLEDGLDTLDNDLRTYLTYVLDEVSGVALSLDDLARTIIAYWSVSPTGEVSYAESVAEEQMSSEELTADADFREIDLPEVYDDYTPVPSFGDNPPDDLGLGHVENPVSHNALLRLVRAPRGSGSGNRSINLPVNSSGLPDIEVDFGNMGSLVSGMGSFATWIEWLSGVLFGLLLTVKGLTMYRICRSATTYASVGENPTVHLAWNPF